MRSLPLVLSGAFSLLLSTGASYSTDNSTTEACSRLLTFRRNNTVTASDGQLYTAQREAHWSATAYKNPSCIFTPGNVNDLVEAVKIIGSTGSKWSVRSGGHSPLPNWANIDEGVLLWMHGLKDISYDSTSETVRTGFGNTWGEVYEYLENFGRLAVGGRAPTVGLALLTGGGLSHLSSAYGFATDNVVSYEVILANGTQVIASGTSNPDLFYAIKGGNNNFGIIHHVTLKTYPVGKVWGGTIVYTNDYRDQVMGAFAEYQQTGQNDSKSALLSYMGINNNTLYVTLMYLDAVERPAAFQAFYNIPSAMDLTSIYPNFTSVIDQTVDLVVPRWTWGATSFYLDKDTYVQVARITQNATSLFSGINGATMVLMPQPISPAMISQSHARGTNPMSENLTAKAQMWFCINIGWNFASDDGKIANILTDTLKQIEALTKTRNLYDPFIFLNDAHYSQKPISSYGSEAFSKMEAVSKAYDPQLVLQTQLRGGFKLSAES